MKMTPHSQSDIPIGNNQWIHFIDIIAGHEAAVPVDSELAGIEDLIDALDKVCEPECCGLAAYDFTPGSIVYALTRLGQNQVLPKLNEAIHLVEANPAQVFSSRQLNNDMDKRVLLQILNHLRDNVVDPLDLRPPSDFVYVPKPFVEQIVVGNSGIEAKIVALVIKYSLSLGYAEARLSFEFISEQSGEEPATVNRGVNLALERGLISRRPYKNGFAYSMQGILKAKGSRYLRGVFEPFEQ